MRIGRHLTAALATVLTVGAVSLVGPAASAATATKIVSGTDGKGWIYDSSYRTQPGAPVYGDTLTLSIEVETTAGDQVFDGTITVQRQLPKHGWKTIKTASSAYLYDTVKAVGNANYRVLYSGSGDYSPSSAGVKSKVQHKLEYKNVGSRHVVLSGKVSPKYKGKAVIFKKHGKKFKKYKTVHTNKKGKFRTPLPAPRKGRYYWKIQVPSNKSFTKTQSPKFYTYSY